MGSVEARIRAVRRLIGMVVVAVVAVGGMATPAAADGPEFRNGEAEARAATFSLNIKQGNANIGFTYGRSAAYYRDTTGTGEAEGLDLGVLPTLFGEVQCDGSPPTLNPATFPPVARVDSTEPNAGASRRTEVFVPGIGQRPAGASAGWQDAFASRLPSARAITESVRIDTGLIVLRGGRTETTASLKDGVREARAVVAADELRVFGDLFSFREPRWEAVARSGGETLTHGSFTFERALVLGQRRSPEQAMADLAAFKRLLEDLLRPLGVKLNLPRVEAEDGRVRVTPMEFLVDDMPWGAQAIAPFLGNIQPLRDALNAQLVAEDCKNASTLLLLDVVLGILAGSGAIEFAAGGVDAMTADTDFSSPPLPDLPVDTQQPGSPAPAPAPVPVAVAEAPLAEFDPIDDFGFSDIGGFEPLDGFDGIDGGFDTGFESTEAETEVAAATATNDTEELAAAAAFGQSRFEDSAAGRAAVVVGTLGLLGALSLAFGERLFARRSARRIP